MLSNIVTWYIMYSNIQVPVVISVLTTSMATQRALVGAVPTATALATGILAKRETVIPVRVFVSSANLTLWVTTASTASQGSMAMPLMVMTSARNANAT